MYPSDSHSSTKYLVYTLFLSSLLIGLVSSQITYETHSVPVTKDYLNAIDAAIIDVITDKTFQDTFASLMFFPVPQCSTTSVSYPKINPFIGRKALVCCREIGAIYPFGDVKQLLADTLVKKINLHYGTNYEIQTKIIDTSKLGFFTTMKNAVDGGECDIITTNVQITTERQKQIHFQCPWGSTSKGYLRTEKESDWQLNSFSSLNQTGVYITAYKGTTYETDVLTGVPAANYIPGNNSDAQYEMILKKQVHAAVDNSVTLLTWLNVNRKECQNCSVYFIGQPYGFSTFTTSLVISGASVVCWSNFILLVTIVSIIFSN